jgi:hypothetical protein
MAEGQEQNQPADAPPSLPPLDGTAQMQEQPVE